ncbi:hypothetical protein EDB80DRAFT_815372 [Ilyonectria destructans]|nr:hypothetical protein EDB80DRAFT_815372 [Ilyonectria destructans]
MSKVSEPSVVEPASILNAHSRDGTPPAAVPWGKFKSTACRRCHSRKNEATLPDCLRLYTMKDARNFSAQEYYRHVEAIRAALETVYTKRKAAMQTLRETDEASFLSNLPQPGQTLSAQVTTGGIALNEPSLQELLAQPMLDLQFLDGSGHDAYS